MVLEKQRTMLHGNPVYSSESYDNIRWSESSHYYWPAPMKAQNRRSVSAKKPEPTPEELWQKKHLRCLRAYLDYLSLLLEWKEPVSYTHLDVYKRQILFILLMMVSPVQDLIAQAFLP